MNFTHFIEIFLQQCLVHCNPRNRTEYGNTEKKEWTEFSWRNYVYNAKLRVESRLEHDFAIEYMYFQWL